MLLFLQDTLVEVQRLSAFEALRYIKTEHLSNDLFSVFFDLLGHSEFHVRKVALSVLSRMIQCLSAPNLKKLQIAMSDPGNAFSPSSALVAADVFSIQVLLNIGREHEWNLSKKLAEAKSYIESHLEAASTVEEVWQIKLLLLRYQSQLSYLHDPAKESPTGDFGLFAKEWRDETDAMMPCSAEWVDIMNTIKARLASFV